MSTFQAESAHLHRRHVWQIISFFLMVALPTLLAGWYLFERAHDQFVSDTSFAVRSEEFRNPMDVLAGLGQVSTGSSSDAQVLYEFISSQQLVQQLESELRLRHMLEGNGYDPVFSLAPGASLEQLVRVWNRMVQVHQDKGSGVINVETRAFRPQDAQTINRAILRESQTLVDRLSRIARNDATRYAEEELERASQRLAEARKDFSEYQVRTGIVDPTIELQNQAGVQGALRQQLAEAIIARERLASSTRDNNDPRISQADNLIEAIRNRLKSERSIVPTGHEDSLAKVVGDFERLRAEQEFAQTAYYAASAALDSARAEATRRSRYLAVHIEPTLPETSTQPRRLILTSAVFLFLTLLWIIGSMVIYSLRDRR